MNILQFQITDTNEEELNIAEEFSYWLCDQMFVYLNTKINRRKIQLRLNYIYEVPWIKWKSKDYIGVNDIMKGIRDSFVVESYRNNVYKIRTDLNVLIPNSLTSMDRLIRFLNFGDNKCKPTAMFTKLQQEFKHKKLNALWRIYATGRLGYISQARIVAD